MHHCMISSFPTKFFIFRGKPKKERNPNCRNYYIDIDRRRWSKYPRMMTIHSVPVFRTVLLRKSSDIFPDLMNSFSQKVMLTSFRVDKFPVLVWCPSRFRCMEATGNRHMTSHVVVGPHRNSHLYNSCSKCSRFRILTLCVQARWRSI